MKKPNTVRYSFDQSVRKCYDRFVFNMMDKNDITFPYRGVSTVSLLCQTSCPPQQQLTRCGARTRDHRREATLLLLVVLQSGAAVAVVWAHARTQELCL